MSRESEAKKPNPQTARTRKQLERDSSIEMLDATVRQDPENTSIVPCKEVFFDLRHKHTSVETTRLSSKDDIHSTSIIRFRKKMNFLCIIQNSLQFENYIMTKKRCPTIRVIQK
jgi:hypothetical protein